MNIMKKTLLFILSIILVLNVTAFADEAAGGSLTDKWMSDLDYNDMINKYDFIEKIERDDEEVVVGNQEEVITNKYEVETVLALGIMSRLEDGTFSQDNTVPFNEFAKIVMRLNIGENESFASLYDQYSDTQPVSQSLAVQYMVKACGYEVYQEKYSGEAPWNSVAREIDLIDGIVFKADKLITRGELAKLIYNTLSVDYLEQVSFGENEDYEVIKGRNLLKERFDAIEVEGVLTALAGINLFSDVAPENSWVEIDRIRYKATNIEAAKYFGHQVIGIARLDRKGNYELIVLDYHPDNKNASFMVEDIVNITDGKIEYSDGDRTKRISIGSSTRVVYNGTYTPNYKLSDIPASDAEITYISKWNGNESILVINEYSVYKVDRVNIADEKIYLDHNAKFDKSTYINAKEESNTGVTIIKGDKEISVDEIKPGNVISVFQNKNKTYLHIVVSDSVAEGTITEVSGDEIFVNDSKYPISKGYYDAKITDTYLSSLDVGTQGTFYLSFSGGIASFEEGGGKYLYGYLRQIGTEGQGFDGRVAIRVLTAKGKWETLTLADKLTLDGAYGISAEDAYTTISNNADKTLYGIIRYGLNSDSEVNFLDTLIDNKAESNDIGRVSIVQDPRPDTPKKVNGVPVWTGAFNWTSLSHPHLLDSSKYWFADTSVFFCVPGDKDKEEKYEVKSALSYKMETAATLVLYSADAMGRIPVAEFIGAADTAINYDSRAMLVTRKSVTLSEDEEQTYAFTGVFSANTAMQTKSLCLSQSLYEKVKAGEKPDVQPGDLIKYVEVDGEMIDYTVQQAASKVYDTTENDRALTDKYHWFEALGTVTDVIAELGKPATANLGLVKIEVPSDGGSKEWVFAAYTAVVFERATGRAYECPLSEVEIGDRAFFRGAARYMALYIYR